MKEQEYNWAVLLVLVVLAFGAACGQLVGYREGLKDGIQMEMRDADE